MIFDNPKWRVGALVQKIKGSKWKGKIVGYYSTELTPRGYCVESMYEKGSVQIYPEAALMNASTRRYWYPYSEENCPNHIADPEDRKRCGLCGIHIDELRP